MLRFFADQNFNGGIVRGTILREPKSDIVRIQDTEADGAKDPEVLEWAAKENRVVLTHDRTTLPGVANAPVARGERMPGVVVVHNRLGIGRAIDDVLLIADCMEPSELDGRVIFVPI